MGRKQTYRVQLSEEEREQLRTMSRTGKQSARVMQRAQILLWSDAGKQDKVNWSATPSNRCHASQDVPSEWITDMNDKACAMPLCSFNRWQAGAR